MFSGVFGRAVQVLRLVQKTLLVCVCSHESWGADVTSYRTSLEISTTSKKSSTSFNDNNSARSVINIELRSRPPSAKVSSAPSDRDGDRKGFFKGNVDLARVLRRNHQGRRYPTKTGRIKVNERRSGLNSAWSPGASVLLPACWCPILRSKRLISIGS